MPEQSTVFSTGAEAKRLMTPLIGSVADSVDSAERSSGGFHAPVSIVLATLNARFIHASLGLRCILANMGELRPKTVLCEFTLSRSVRRIVIDLLEALGRLEHDRSAEARKPLQVIGFGIYVWNVLQTTEVIRLLKTEHPEIKIVLGGPEVSHEQESQEIVVFADHVISGWGDLSFPQLCRDLINGSRIPPKAISGLQAPLDLLAMPYAEYTDFDLAHRVTYLEASRGCPFRCEFCLSALDKTAQAFDLGRFLFQLDQLIRRGARHFKFVDRTFNLRTESSVRILRFFLDRIASLSINDLFVHFEVVPDHFPEALKSCIACFPPGSLQLEVGVQTFNVDVQELISRRQDNKRTEANLKWLLTRTSAHVHADLVFGLPGESLESFGQGFDRLFALRPHEIQLGLLKRLRGALISRHAQAFQMEFDRLPPYAIRQTRDIDVNTVVRFSRFSRYWELLANSGRFRRSVELIAEVDSVPARIKKAGLTDQYPVTRSPFWNFMAMSDYLWEETRRTYALSPECLVDLLMTFMVAECGLPQQAVKTALLEDYVCSGARGRPESLSDLLLQTTSIAGRSGKLASRQELHRLQAAHSIVMAESQS